VLAAPKNSVLATAVKSSTSVSYKYGADGLRTQKTVGSTVYNYYYADGLLIRQTWGTSYMDFLYDESGSAYSFIYNGTQYYYVKNLQGDVMRIVNTSGTVVANYFYDAWGKVTNSGNIIGLYNPIRYRGYYYDTDTGFYYLQSRYYDPAIKRFINADGYINANGDILGFNMFAYCGNSPIAHEDSCGKYVESALDVASLVADVVDIVANPANPFAWISLAADVASLILPGVTGGGSIVRVVAKSDKLLDLAKHTDDIVDAQKAISSSLDLGKAAHKAYDPIKDTIEASEKLLNKSLKQYGSRLRPDGVDFTNRIIYELKPYNKHSFNQALKQVEKYRKVLGGNWIIVIDMYK